MRSLPALFLFLISGPAQETQSADRPNVILAMADDQGWGDMAYNGHPALKTPVFDEMARTGLRFDRFYAAAPVCSPTRGSVMTGRTPNRFGCFKWGYTLRPEEVTVAEVLRDAGYATGHFGKWHLGSMRADSPVSPGQSGFEQWFSSPNFFDIDPWMSHGGKAFQTKGEGSEVIVDAALDFIRKSVREDRPFLAVVWFGSPHAPHAALEADLAIYADQPKNKRAFLAEITAMDRAMGKLRKGVRDAGVADKTLLWYCSDNGAIAEGSTGGLRGKKGQIWEGGLRVPGLLEWPAKIRRPRVTGHPCCTVDIYPTLLELAGARAARQPPLDGVSLAPLLEGKMESRPRPLGFWDHTIGGLPVKSTELLEELAREQAAGKVRPAGEAEPIPAAQLRRDYADQAFPGHSAWLDGDWKLHRIETKDGRVKWELYNLAIDRTESMDRLAAEPDRASRMKTALAAWLRSVVASLNGKDYAETSRDVMRRLADLALVPPTLNTSPLPDYDYDRLDYGMTIGIERTPKGRLWACWVAGGDSPKAFFVLATSDDDGETWSKPRLVVDAHSKNLPVDRSVLVGNLWTDPLGRLWLIFDQSMDMFDGRAGVWAAVCENPDADRAAWSWPRRIWHGVTLNKPTVLSTGEWMLPISLDQRQGFGPFKGLFKELDPYRGANVFVSTDQGVTWQRRGAVRFPNPDWHEHMIVERKDGTLWMLARTAKGIMQSTSADGGRTWAAPTDPPGIRQPNARFHIRRLASGRLLLVKHGDAVDAHQGRVKLSAWLSEDDGRTWQGGLILDDRKGVSYPDGFQSPDGTVYISYDRNRASDGEILLARFTEVDVLAKNLVGPRSKLKMLISRPLGLKKESRTP